MQTLIVVGVVIGVLVLVFAVVQFASRPPKVRSYWDSKESVAGREWAEDD
ncbi:hypothetical protein [Nocardia sp. NPDC048505]